MGYYRAGFSKIVGVDIEPQKRYPFEFVQADALEFCEKWGRDFDMVVGSPPCQPYSVTSFLSNGNHPRLIGETRRTMKATGRPYVIENVPGAPLINPIKLCGTMFPDLRVIRHRLFECSPVVWFPLGCCYHWGSVSACGRGKSKNNPGGGRLAMGIDWMTKAELSQAIPPAYTEWLGKQMLSLI